MAAPLMDAQTRPRHSTVLDRLYRFTQADNLADELPAQLWWEGQEVDRDQWLSNLGAAVVKEFEIDEGSNTKWTETASKAMNLALQTREVKNTPFANASNIKWPLITVAALQFNARSYPEIFADGKIVKAKVVGADPDGQKKEKADRISEHMSYQLTEEMDGWEDDMDTLLIQLPIVGTVFKKVYHDSGEKHSASELIPGIDLVVNRNTKSLKRAPRVTQRLTFFPHEIEERQRDGRWLDEFKDKRIDFGTPSTDAGGDKDAAHEFLEQHRRIDLDNDGYGEPYIVTVHKESNQVVRMEANYSAEDVKSKDNRVTKIAKREYFVKYGFIPDPEGGFYDIGFGRLLESLGAAIDTTINQMLDAGHLQNAGGGFIGSGVRLKKSVYRMEPGVYHTVQSSGDKLRDAIVNMEHPGPSAVLFNLLGLMIEAARDITGVKDILTGQRAGQGGETATTTLALIEQGLKTFTAIYKRIYRSLRKEFKLLFRLNAEHLDAEAYYTVLDQQKAIAKSDYEIGSFDVCPQADPKLVTDMQRMARAQIVVQFKDDPRVDGREALRRYFLAAGEEEVDKLVPEPQPNPMAEAAAKLQIAGAEAEIANTTAETEKTQVEAAAVAERERRENAKAEIEAVTSLAGLAKPQEAA